MIQRKKPRLDDGNNGQKEFDERIAILERRIVEQIKRHGRRDLDILLRAGIDRKAIFKALAFVVDEEGSKDWAGLARMKQQSLKRLAKRMHNLACDSEKLVHDPFSAIRTYFFVWAYGHAAGMPSPGPLADDRTVPFIISGMRVLASFCRVGCPYR